MKLLAVLSKLLTQRDQTTAINPLNPPILDPIVRLLATALREQGFDTVELGNRLKLRCEIELQVEFLESVEFSNGNLRTSTRITSYHASYFPLGLAEFQHSVGSSVEQSLSDGFANWAKTDLVALQDSVREKPEDCTFMDMSFPASLSSGPKVRRVVFGPTGHFASSAAHIQEEDHPFCPCCLFTRNFEAFRSLIQSEETVGIRLFASRDNNGEITADCRINGEGFPEGVEHLKRYALTWSKIPGLEFRKQYVVIRSVGSLETNHSTRSNES